MHREMGHGNQDVYFEPTYKPRKDDADPLDFLSRHPLPITGKDAVEKVAKYMISKEHVVVMDNIREETLKDSHLQKLSVMTIRGDWDKHMKDPDVAPFYEVHQEVSIVDDLISGPTGLPYPQASRER